MVSDLHVVLSMPRYVVDDNGQSAQYGRCAQTCKPYGVVPVGVTKNLKETVWLELTSASPLEITNWLVNEVSLPPAGIRSIDGPIQPSIPEKN